MNTTCRRCSECDGMSHHWTPDPMAIDDENYQPGDYACKHCDQRGECCAGCDEVGCPDCNMEGVIPLKPSEHLMGLILGRWDRWQATAEQTAQAAQDTETGFCLLQVYLVEAIEEVYPPTVAVTRH